MILTWFRRTKPRPVPCGNRCSFCSKNEPEVSTLFSGPNESFICSECLEVAEEIFRDQAEHPSNSPPLGLQCSFCLRSDKELKYLVAGPTVYICDGCVSHFRRDII